MSLLKIIALAIPIMQLFVLVYLLKEVASDSSVFFNPAVIMTMFFLFTTLFLAISCCVSCSKQVLKYARSTATTISILIFVIIVVGITLEVILKIYSPWMSLIFWFFVYLFYWILLGKKGKVKGSDTLNE